MSLLVFAGTLLILRVLVSAADQGSIVHRRLRDPGTMSALIDELERQRDRGVDARLVSLFSGDDNFGIFGASAPRRRGAVLLSWKFLIPWVICWLICLIPFIPVWLPAGYLALSTAVELPLARFRMRITGKLRGENPSTGRSHAVEWTGRVVAFAFYLFGYWALLLRPADYIDLAPTLPVPVQMAWLAFLLLVAGSLIDSLSQRVAVLFQKITFAEAADDQTILYLRSFGDDQMRIYTPTGDGSLWGWLWPRVRFEGLLFMLAQSTSGSNFVTVGEPRERLPLRGASRVYYRSGAKNRAEEWQVGVRDTVMRCRAVVLACGATEALAWEVGRLREWGVLGKCLFLVPPGGREDSSRRIEALVSALGVHPELWTQSGLDPELVGGVSLKDDGRLAFWMTNGRDWFNYTLVLSCHWEAMDTTTTDSFWDDKMDTDAPTVASTHEPKPERPPASLASMLRRFHVVLSGRDRQTPEQFLASIFKLAADSSSADPAAAAYIAYQTGIALADVGRGSEAVAEWAKAERSAETITWVWVDPWEVRSSEEFRFECLGRILEVLGNEMTQASQQGTVAMTRRQAAEKSVTLARGLLDRRSFAQACLSLGFATRNVDELAAQSAFGDAADAFYRLGDRAAEGRARFQQGAAANRCGEWALGIKLCIEAADALEAVNDYEMSIVALLQATNTASLHGEFGQATDCLDRARGLVLSDDHERLTLIEDEASHLRATENQAWEAALGEPAHTDQQGLPTSGTPSMERIAEETAIPIQTAKVIDPVHIGELVRNAMVYRPHGRRPDSSVQQKIESVEAQIAQLTEEIERLDVAKMAGVFIHKGVSPADKNRIRQRNQLLADLARLRLETSASWQPKTIDLEARRAILVCSECIAEMPLHDEDWSRAMGWSTMASAVGAGWPWCTARNWLNSAFLDCLPPQVRDHLVRITTTSVLVEDTLESPDYVFLPSVQEAKSMWPDDRHRRAKAGGKYTQWWLRDAGMNGVARSVYDSGTVSTSYQHAFLSGGIRPVVTVDLMTFANVAALFST